MTEIRSHQKQWYREFVGTGYLEIKVPEVVGKQRPRVTKTGHAYTPKKTKDFESLIAGAWVIQNKLKWANHEGPVEVAIYIERQLARSNPKYWAGRYDTQKPDVDNIEKSILDALNGVAFKDDSQINRVSCTKSPRVPYGRGNKITVLISYYREDYF